MNESIGKSIDLSVVLPNEPPVLLPEAAAVLRGLLTDTKTALDIAAPCDARKQDSALDQRVAPLTRSFYRLYRFTAAIDSYYMLLAGDELTLVDHDVIALCRSICESAQPYFALCGVELRFHSDRTAKKIALNADWFERALLNLLANALRTTTRGDTVTVRVQCDADTVAVSVTDTGHGISVDRLDTLFERKPMSFTLTDAEHGLGLGLPMCRLIAEKHSGTIRASADANGGVCFTLSLPNARSKLALFHEMKFDYAGGYSHLLIELSDALPVEAYLQKHLK